MTEMDIRKAFKVFDKYNDGKIKVDLLRSVLSKVGEPLTEKEFDKLKKLSRGAQHHTTLLRVLRRVMQHSLQDEEDGGKVCDEDGGNNTRQHGTDRRTIHLSLSHLPNQ